MFQAKGIAKANNLNYYKSLNPVRHMEITYVTTNKGKVSSLSRHLLPYGISVVQKPIDLPEPRDDNVEVIAKHKAFFAYSILKEPLVVLDAGFYVKSLNGFPKAFVNFALDTIDIGGILKLVEGKERECEFKHCLAYIDGTLTQPVLFVSSVKGIIAQQSRGKMQDHLWSKLGLIFIPEHGNRTLAEMSKEEYDAFWKDYPGEVSCQEKFGEWYFNQMKQ